MAIIIEDKIQFWKKSLLDLGKRNRLINFKTTKRSTLSITNPSFTSLWNSFVEDEKKLVFDGKNNILTDKETDEDLKATLRNIRSKANSISEEQGINTLYLAFGFLSWEEDKTPLKSPILLVPVRLTLKNLMSNYTLSLSDDEIVVNPALSYKFKKEYNITLPDFDETIELDDFFSQMRHLANKNKWLVLEEVELSLFSFLKINMYNDLERNKDKIANHPIIKAITGDPSDLPPLPKDILSPDYDLDLNIKPENTYQVLNADASQQKAILCANNGISFILQGPPGTGKSQTITNIIAESIANNKKVLFVSEKIAALDVVHTRLKECGLDDFCLVLHSHKANKQDVLEQLNNSLQLSNLETKVKNSAKLKLKKLYEDKVMLNSYSNELHKTISPLNLSVYEVNGKIASLEALPLVSFDIVDVRNVSEEQFMRYIEVLTTFKDVLSEQILEPNSNPWKNTTITSLSNELRATINTKVPSLTNKLNFINKVSNTFCNLTSLDSVFTYNTLQTFKEVLEKIESNPQLPYCFFINNDLDNLSYNAEIASKNGALINSVISEIKDLYDKLSPSFKSIFNIGEDDSLYNISFLTEIKKDITNIINNDHYLLESYGNKDVSREFESLKSSVEKIREVKHQLLTKYDESILDIDYKGILLKIKTEYSSFLRIFNKNYKADLNLLKGKCKEIGIKMNYKIFTNDIVLLNTIDEEKEKIQKRCITINPIFSDKIDNENTDLTFIAEKLSALSIFDQLQAKIDNLQEKLTKAEEKDDVYKTYFDFLYTGLSTNWKTVKEAISWAKELTKYINNFEINKSFIQYICTERLYKETISNFLNDIRKFQEESKEDLSFYLSLFKNEEIELIKNTPLQNLIERTQKSSDNLAFLEQWLDFNKILEECSKEGLSEYINEVINNEIEEEDIIKCFEKTFYTKWLDSVLNEVPYVRDFRRYKQEDTIEDFSKLDKEQCEIAKARIKDRLIDSLPVVQSFTTSNDEVGILKKEINKQRRRMPLRKLFNLIPNLIMKFKPCLMMSPLSVSLFLESNDYNFDIVIFDEASQVRSENAIGAIMRGKQVIIAGDTKQLPPTSFFTATSSDSDIDIDEDSEDEDEGYESIIEEANLLPETTLEWHYRSRDESLIAFSNVNIYKKQLITFPSNKLASTKDNGVECIYLKDGFYDRGGSKGNVIEAQKVADLIFEHIKNHPERSLGVITFGEKQMHAIEDIVILRRQKEPEYEEFFSENNEDPFFIKNLENVQGDERDTIIFSVGYGKDINGIFRMNFGPLSKKGGERRLNVAITRAKQNIKLVTSILPTDIDLTKVSSDGPKLLRSYIDFAMNGVQALGLNEDENLTTKFSANTLFENVIYNFLTSRGYKVSYKIGTSEFRIDLAVEHPVKKDSYVLGIQCDGLNYHKAKTTRDRDSLRNSVLESMGWNLYTVWSTDWIKDPKTEGDALLKAIEDSIKGKYNKKSPKKELNAPTFLKVEIKNEEESENIYEFEKEDITGTDLLPESLKIEIYDIETLENFMEGHGEYFAADFMAIIKKCSPIHVTNLAQQLINHTHIENKKVNRKVEKAVESILWKKVTSGRLLYVNKFFMLKNDSFPTHFNNARSIKQIPEQEITKAMYNIITKRIGLTVESLYKELAVSYNLKNVTKTKEEVFDRAFALLTDVEIIKVVDEKIQLIESK